jgi:hypothetical protein
MFRLDTVNDTTPEVTQLIRELSQTSHARTHADTDIKAATHASQDSLHVCGHVLLSGMPRVAILARRRELLLYNTINSSAPSSKASHVVFTRLVLSLLGSTATEDKRSPVLTNSRCSLESGAGEASTCAVTTFPTQDGFTPLPWCPAMAVEEEVADVAYNAYCLSGSVAGKSSQPSRLRPFTPTTMAHDKGFACRLELRSYPVAVLPSSVIRALSQYWHNGPTSSRGDADKVEEQGHDMTSDASPSLLGTASSVTAPCVAQALELFRERVCSHERSSLICVTHMCTTLLRRLDTVSAQGSTSPAKSEAECHDNGGLGDGDNEDKLPIVIPVPVYGVALAVEDNQATRLERVENFTTPLLREATGVRSPMRPLTAILHQLHAWATEDGHKEEEHSLRQSVHAVPQLVLTRERLGKLHRYASHVLACATTPLSDLEVVQRCPLDLVLPACLVHCQLGVSRSPSVVLLFYMHLFRSQWRCSAMQKTCEAARQMRNCSAKSEDTTKAATEKDASTDDADITVHLVAAAEVFHSLLAALARARPRVKPNVCFAAQLLALWNKRICGAEEPA